MAQVKLAVFEQTKVPPERQKLYFGGTELGEGETLAHCLWTALKKVMQMSWDAYLSISIHARGYVYIYMPHCSTYSSH
jgi:hypothetical protein